VKAELGREGVVVEQMHRDEVGGEVSFAYLFVFILRLWGVEMWMNMEGKLMIMG